MKKNIKINMIPVQSKSLCAKCIRNDFGELCRPSKCDSCVQHSDVPLHYLEESTLQQTEVRCKCLSEEYYGKPCHGFVREPDSKDITVHHLKCCKPFFDDIWEGKKLFELRKNDRNYGIDDELVLHE